MARTFKTRGVVISGALLLGSLALVPVAGIWLVTRNAMPAAGGFDEPKPPMALDGVVASFKIDPPEIGPDLKLKLLMKLTNTGQKETKFKYIACMEQHIEILDEHSEVIRMKDGAPILECPYEEVAIAAAATVERTEYFDLSPYYSLSPGKYRMRFKYDTRLLGNPIRPDPWVLWSNDLIDFTVGRGKSR
jgi:hypothetical protein